MLSTLHSVDKEQNLHSAEREKLEQGALAAQYEREGVVQDLIATPLKETAVIRELKVIKLQVELLEEADNAPQLFDHKAFKENYQERLREIEYYFYSAPNPLEKAKYRNFAPDSIMAVKAMLVALTKHKASLEEQEFQQFNQELQASQESADKKYEQKMASLQTEAKQLVHKKKAQLESDDIQFFAACESGELAVVKILVQGQSRWNRKKYVNQINVEGLTALHKACLGSRLAVCEYLVGQKADPTKQDSRGYSPFHCASIKGDAALLSFFKSCIKDIQIIDRGGQTGLHLASWHGNLPAVNWFIRQSFPLDSPAAEKRFKRTALHCAAHRGHTEVVARLLEAGANASAKNTNGETPLMETIYAGQEETALAFLAAGFWLKNTELEKLFSGKQGNSLRVFVNRLLEKERSRFPLPAAQIKPEELEVIAAAVEVPAVSPNESSALASLHFAWGSSSTISNLESIPLLQSSTLSAESDGSSVSLGAALP